MADVITESHGVLRVEAPVSNYVIEPHRFALGLTKVEMVDDHLARLIVDGRHCSPDADALLDARVAFAVSDA